MASPPVEGTAMRIGEKSLVSFGARLALPLLVVAGFVAWIDVVGTERCRRPTRVAASCPQFNAEHRASDDDAAIAQPPAAAPGDTAPTGAIAAAPQTPQAEPKPRSRCSMVYGSPRNPGVGRARLEGAGHADSAQRQRFAVRDIEIACAFTRRDGSHLTDRKRVISDTIQHEEPKDLSAHAGGIRKH